MGVVILLCLSPSVAAVVVGVLRSRSRTRWDARPSLPGAYAVYRPDRHPAVVAAEDELSRAYADLAALYETPTLSGPPRP